MIHFTDYNGDCLRVDRAEGNGIRVEVIRGNRVYLDQRAVAYLVDQLKGKADYQHHSQTEWRGSL